MRRLLQLAALLVLSGMLAGKASAEIIDDIILKSDANGEVDALIKFTVPIQYVRHFPERPSVDMTVYFNVLSSVPREQWLNYESHRSPPSELIRGFTVTTRDMSTGPRIEVQFNRAAEFRVTPGRDNQTLLIHLKPELAAPKNEGAASVPGTIVAPPATVPAATPATAQPQQGAKAAPAQLGGKDGLPYFPRIEPVAPEAAKATSGPLPLAEQIRKENDQAALLMVKGRDALLTGELFTAIEAFNGVLNLPPNKYSADAQLWIGIAREKAGLIPRAKSEYETYLKLYPTAAEVAWVRQRLARLEAVAPSPTRQQVKPRATEFEFTQYGSVSSYYYYGNSQTDTVKTVGNTLVPTTLTVNDQNSLITTASLTGRYYNSEYDNRLVFQGYKSVSFLPRKDQRSRVNAAYYDLKSRSDNYSARLGIQSALGGGVLGRFNGISGGYGFTPNWRANLSAGTLTDVTLESKPRFYSVGFDFGVESPLGGSVYYINQKTSGITDRKAAGGNLRYFEQGRTALSLIDYDLQFKALNMLTLQGTVNTESGTDYNFYFDRRRSPLFSIMNAVNGAVYTHSIPQIAIDPATGLPILDPFTGLPLTFFTFNSAPVTIASLRQNGFTQDDLIALARKRTAISTIWQVGMTNRIKEQWQIGTDVVASNTSGMSESGTCHPDGTTGIEGCMPAFAPTGTTWSVSERVSGSSIFSKLDLSTFSLGYSRSPVVNGKTLLFNNHSYPFDSWTLDTTLRMYQQNDRAGTRLTTYTGILKAGYRLRNSLTLEVEGGMDRTRVASSVFLPSTTLRKYISVGGRWDF